MKLFRVSCAAAAAAIAQLAVGQTAAPESNPADSQATTAPAHYQSAFSGYRPYRDAELANWREVNDQVRQATDESDGTRHVGHAGHRSSAAAAPAGHAHAGHGSHAGHGNHGASDARRRDRKSQQ